MPELETRFIQADLEFWAEHLDEPEFAVVTAVRS
jgi:hypothetical protein